MAAEDSQVHLHSRLCWTCQRREHIMHCAQIIKQLASFVSYHDVFAATVTLTLIFNRHVFCCWLMCCLTSTSYEAGVTGGKPSEHVHAKEFAQNCSHGPTNVALHKAHGNYYQAVLVAGLHPCTSGFPMVFLPWYSSCRRAAQTISKHQQDR